jgi:hypothetical protein
VAAVTPSACATSRAPCAATSAASTPIPSTPRGASRRASSRTRRRGNRPFPPSWARWTPSCRRARSSSGWRGQELRLDAILEEPAARELFVIFGDTTSGDETYPGGRFLYAPLPREGRTVLDFNKAYNPPCAFTPCATCPLAPRQNPLPVAVRAGEKTYGEHDQQ